MSAPPAQPPEQNSAGATGKAADSQLLMDQFLPRYDFAVVHADVLRAPPAQCFGAASELDLFQAPLVRTLLGIRGLPQRVVGTLRGRGKTTTLEASQRTFRFKDLVGLGWILLGETPGVELVLGQVSRPWKAVAVSTDAPTTPEQFTSFDEPGFAKIAASIRIDPYGNDSSILTLETRVAITDDTSRRRFRRYWLLIGPFSSLIRRMALRLLATEFRRSAPGRPDDGGPRSPTQKVIRDSARRHAERGTTSPITSHIEIARSAEDVFAYATDPSRFSEWQDDVVSARAEAGQAPGVGSWFTTIRRMGRSERAMTQEVTESRPPTNWAAHGVDGPVRPNVDMTVEPLADNTRSRIMVVMDFEAHGIGKLLVPLIVRRQAAKRAPQSYQHLKEQLERRS